MEKSDNKENLNKINWNILGILTTFWKWSDEITESRRQNWGDSPKRHVHGRKLSRILGIRQSDFWREDNGDFCYVLLAMEAVGFSIYGNSVRLAGIPAPH